MNVRPASFRDLSRVEQLYGEAMAGDDRGTPLSSEPTMPQATTLVRLWYGVTKTLSSLMPLTEADNMLYVAEHPQEGIVGFVQAEAVTGKPKAWQVVNLCTASSAAGRGAALPLLSGLCHGGQEASVNRFHVRVPLDHALLSVFLEQGFSQFATEQILFREQPEANPTAPLLRAARRDDIGSLYLLYLRTAPATVAAIEGPSRRAWETGFAGGTLARLGRDSTRHLVMERPGIVAWTAVRPATAMRPAQVTLMCDVISAEEREAFLDAALAELGTSAASCVLRHYDQELIRALQARGFAVYGTQLLLVRDLGVRLRVRARARNPRKKSVLAPAGLVRNVPNSVRSGNPLRVLSTVTATGVGRSEKSSPR